MVWCPASEGRALKRRAAVAAVRPARASLLVCSNKETRPRASCRTVSRLALLQTCPDGCKAALKGALRPGAGARQQGRAGVVTSVRPLLLRPGPATSQGRAPALPGSAVPTGAAAGARSGCTDYMLLGRPGSFGPAALPRQWAADETATRNTGRSTHERPAPQRTSNGECAQQRHMRATGERLLGSDTA